LHRARPRRRPPSRRRRRKLLKMLMVTYRMKVRRLTKEGNRETLLQIRNLLEISKRKVMFQISAM